MQDKVRGKQFIALMKMFSFRKVYCRLPKKVLKGKECKNCRNRKKNKGFGNVNTQREQEVSYKENQLKFLPESVLNMINLGVIFRDDYPDGDKLAYAKRMPKKKETKSFRGQFEAH